MELTPPSETEWSIEEREEFFAGQDAITGATNVAPNPITLEMLQRTLSEFDAKYSRPDSIYIRGIFVTHLTPPAQGWPIAMYCPICKETTFLLSPWAIKPERGDYWRMTGTCATNDLHNIKMAMDAVPYRRLLFGPYDAVIEQEMTIEEAKKRFPNTPIPGQD